MRRDAGGSPSCSGLWTRPPRRPGARRCRQCHSRACVLRLPHGPVNSDGMPPAGVAAARSTRNVTSRSNGPRKSAWMASALRLEAIPPWRLRLRDLVVVGQPSARDARYRGTYRHGPRLRTDGSTRELKTGRYTMRPVRSWCSPKLTKSQHPLLWCGVNSTLFGKHQLDQPPEPHSA